MDDTRKEPDVNTRAVTAAMRQIDEACGRLANRLGVLEKRLVSVLRAPNPSTTSETKRDESVCDLATKLTEFESRIRQTTGHVGDLVERLEF